MADRLTPEQRSANMSRVRGKDTGPELIVRRLLHAAGLRFRLHRRDLPGRPDVVLPRHRAAIQVHGCFWHGHSCPLFRLPGTRTQFWRDKIDANRRRDAAAMVDLARLGWRTCTVWECALRGRGRLQPVEISDRLRRFVLSADPAGVLAGDFGTGPTLAGPAA